ncbi:MAG: hypothetical protein KJ749_14280, partial [Planctomycetes bacterium]|nr:hypothetical protein [Planctomycetota bacterium]
IQADISGGPPPEQPGGGVAEVTNRPAVAMKGSLVIFPKVEVRWDGYGNVIQDTFIDLTNDYSEDVLVQMYFVNGDAPAAAH